MNHEMIMDKIQKVERDKTVAGIELLAYVAKY